MLNMEGISTEAKIGKILILVSLIIGIVALIIIGIIGALVWTAGGVSGLGIFMTIPLIILLPLFILKLAGLIIGFLALQAADRRDLSTAGILAIIASVLPPLDLIMLIGAIFCLVSREGNEKRGPEKVQGLQ